ncbi:MAG TPA: hypothetical protein PKA55_12105 [Rhodoblastus sp.]|nr:hypothetical protein [Rhodoblastus sp.]
MTQFRKHALLTTSLVLAGALCAASARAQNLNVPAPGSPVAAPAAADGNLGMAILSASINPDGSILRGEGVKATGTSKLSTGVYQVSFVRDITNCVYTISPGEGGIGSGTPEMVGITRRSGDANGVFVQVKNSSNTSIDNSFFVIVYCGR